MQTTGRIEIHPRVILGLILGWLVLLGPGADAQTSLIPVPPGHVKVTVEFRQAGQRAQSGVEVKGRGPGGSVVQVKPKGVTGSARVQVQESQQTIRRSVESFLLVQDGGEASLTVVEQVPEVVWFQQYAYRHLYITEAVVFRQVGTFLAVRPTILPDRRIRVKITPQISKDRMVRLVLSLEVTALESATDNRPTTLKRTVDPTAIAKAGTGTVSKGGSNP